MNSTACRRVAEHRTARPPGGRPRGRHPRQPSPRITATPRCHSGQQSHLRTTAGEPRYRQGGVLISLRSRFGGQHAHRVAHTGYQLGVFSVCSSGCLPCSACNGTDNRIDSITRGPATPNDLRVSSCPHTPPERPRDPPMTANGCAPLPRRHLSAAGSGGLRRGLGPGDGFAARPGAPGVKRCRGPIADSHPGGNMSVTRSAAAPW